MKKLLNVLILTLALNFLAAAGGVAYLFQTGAMNKEKVAAIKGVVFPATTQAAAADKKDQPDPTTQPTLRLEELLAKVSGRPAGEQVEFMQRTFDAQMAQLDRRDRVLQALQVQVTAAEEALKRDRETFAAQQKKLDEREKLLNKDAQDKGFADSLALYDSMPAKQVKEVFMGLDDPTVTRYLRAMEPSRAAKILKEFKSAPETERVQKLIEQIRGPQAAADAGK